MHIVLDMINILLDKYIDFYVKICTDTVKKTFKANRQIVKQLLEPQEACKGQSGKCVVFFKKCLLFLAV